MKFHLFFYKTEAAISPKKDCTIMITQVLLKKKAEECEILEVTAVDNAELQNRSEAYGALFLEKQNGSSQKLFQGRLCEPLMPLTNGLCRLQFIGDSLASKPTEESLEITKFVFANSMTWSIPTPPASIHLVVQAEWIQENEGLIDLMPEIQSQFPLGRINSLNATLRIASSNKQKTGYTPIKTFLERVPPSNTGVLNIYPQETDSFNVSGSNGPLIKRLPRYWYQGTWTLAWHYVQKRVERAHCILPFYSKDFLAIETNEDIEPDFILKLDNLEEKEGFEAQHPYFFEGSSGVSVMEDALKTIQKELLRKYQAILTFEMSLDFAMNLNLGQPIIIRTSSRAVSGIIEQIQCFVTNHQRQATVSCRVTPAWLQEWLNQPFKISHFKSKNAIEGFVQTHFSAHDFLEHIEVDQDAVTQFDKLQALAFPTTSDVSRFLKENPTQVTIRLRSLKTKKCLVHDVWAQLTTI